MGTKSKLVVALAIASALLFGCGNDDPPPPKPESQGGSVEDQLGFTDKSLEAVREQVENQISSCMRAQGFEYVPAAIVPTQAALAGHPELSEDEFDKLFGYGISTLPADARTTDDPNARIRARLSPETLSAYHRALTGGRPELTFYEAVDSGEFTEIGGCTKQVTDSVFKVEPTLLVTLQRALDELDDSIAEDPRMVRADEHWTRCMLDATGESYEDSEDVEHDIRKRFEALGTLPDAGGSGSSRAAALKRLQVLEVDAQAKDNACDRKHLLPVEDVVRAEFEEDFRRRNADLMQMVTPLGTR